MKKTEDLLRKAPRSAPSENLDRQVAAIFNEARQSAPSGWLWAGVPAWATALACMLCLGLGVLIAPERNAETVRIGAISPQPDVLVQVARNDRPSTSSPFHRVKTKPAGFFSSGWTITD